MYLGWIAIPDPLPTFFSFKFLPRLLSYKTLCIFLTLHEKQMAFPLVWPWLHDPWLGGCPARSSGGSGCDHCRGIAVPQQDELGWGEKLGINRLRTILVAALHQHLRLSSRVSKGEVRGTCQTGISISQTLHLLSLLVLPPRKGLS